jgi:hypothetical protein
VAALKRVWEIKMKVTIWPTFLVTALLAGPANGEVLEMPGSETAPQETSYSVTLPGRGMTKDQVENRFGTPPEKVQAVGEPPISRWVYSGFTVYFEYDHVIHAVNHR